MKYVWGLLFLLLFAETTQAEVKLKIHILSNAKLRNVNFEVSSGKYTVLDFTGKILDTLEKKDVLQVRSFDQIMVLIHKNDTIGIGENFEIRSIGLLNTMKISPINHGISPRIYDDDFILKASKNKGVNVINHVFIEHYVAGVIQAEAGIARNKEFYKVQAISTRTFALKNMYKHKNQGFHLCDQTHCQVYKGRCSNTDIMIAAGKTVGQVMVDKNKKLISALFHSNSGGQTANSEDVWRNTLPYLRSVNDTFSIGQRSYYWTKTISKKEWLNYLKTKYNYPVENLSEQKKILEFTQPYRKVYLAQGIKLTKIRMDMKLRSTFFSINTNGEKVTFTGRGFGHGVGMSQEGAMNMAKLGYTYDDILKFYYKNIEIIQLEELNLKFDKNSQ